MFINIINKLPISINNWYLLINRQLICILSSYEINITLFFTDGNKFKIPAVIFLSEQTVVHGNTALWMILSIQTNKFLTIKMLSTDKMPVLCLCFMRSMIN